jgi:hypothetical protein
MSINVNITNELGRVVGLIAAKHPECSIQIEWREGAADIEWYVTATDGATDHEYVVDDERGSWAPLTDKDREHMARGESIFTGSMEEVE